MPVVSGRAVQGLPSKVQKRESTRATSVDCVEAEDSRVLAIFHWLHPASHQDSLALEINARRSDQPLVVNECVLLHFSYHRHYSFHTFSTTAYYRFVQPLKGTGANTLRGTNHCGSASCRSLTRRRTAAAASVSTVKATDPGLAVICTAQLIFSDSHFKHARLLHVADSSTMHLPLDSLQRLERTTWTAATPQKFMRATKPACKLLGRS